jgi:hypothetical protein
LWLLETGNNPPTVAVAGGRGLRTRYAVRRTNQHRFHRTSKGKVVSLRLPAMFAADDMICLVRGIRIAFVKKAIFTTITSALCDKSPQGLADVISQAV